MNRTLGARLAAAILAAATAAFTTGPASAPAAVPGAAPEILTAMRRDLGLTADQATTRLAADAHATTVEQTARQVFGDSYAGSWFDPVGSRLITQTTEPNRAPALRSADTEVRTVTHSARQLDGVKNALDALAGRSAPAAITGWYVDVPGNSVVVSVNPAARDAAAQQFLDRAGRLGDAVRVRQADAVARPLAGIRGGDGYSVDGRARCSIGFSVQGGFVSAGHCGRRGQSATNSGGSALGTFQASTFPGSGDFSWVRAASGATPQPVVNNYSGGTVTVKGSTESAVGASICRSGSTTGWHCGTVQAKNQTVNYAEGTVTGLTKTNVCAEAGDSGGSWMSGSQAQGVTSGGSGDCSSGGTTYFQPVHKILSTYGLKLLTG